ncbi:hypothetical protein ACK9YZ_21560 [Rhizobium sp. ZK1]|uniref:hypothetical protein n=1 Tax=Rhizobium sp. ZK1 TaxID=3389872 RepID=UPI0039F66CE0
MTKPTHIATTSARPGSGRAPRSGEPAEDLLGSYAEMRDLLAIQRRTSSGW